MQKDMHYYGTYALARAAGIKPIAAQIIASAAQFVDDNAKKENIDFTDNASLISRPTAHHCENIKNILPDDQRVVWVPFHFLPGGEGQNFNEKIVCTQDSDIAKEMIGNHVKKTDKKFYLELIGIAAHVYADTFSHYGFSGISSSVNDVETFSIQLHENTNDNILENISNKAERFWEKLQTSAAEFGSRNLGHGGVYTYPDTPFLKWEFEYEDGRISKRDNLESYLAGSKALYSFFREVCENNNEIYSGTHKSYLQIQASLKDILSFQNDNEEARCHHWRTAFKDPTSNFTDEPEAIPEYLGDIWNHQRKNLDDKVHSSTILESSVYNFYKAASYHRHYVLRDLLPNHGIIVA